MRKIVTTAAASVLAAVVSSAASAAPVAPENKVVIVAPASGSVNFGNADPTPYPPLFNDVYEFTTAFARTATIEITSSYPGTTPQNSDFTQNVNFVSNGVKLNATVIPSTSTGQNERRYLANFRIPAGVQNIVVRGSAGENGAYAGILTLSGVPEPSTWALMILGFGAIGGAMRRRNAPKATVRFA